MANTSHVENTRLVPLLLTSVLHPPFQSISLTYVICALEKTDLQLRKRPPLEVRTHKYPVGCREVESEAAICAGMCSGVARCGALGWLTELGTRRVYGGGSGESAS
jgi:hypothetical protein